MKIKWFFISLFFVTAPNIASALEITCERGGSVPSIMKTQTAFDNFFPPVLSLFSGNAERVKGRNQLRFEEYYFRFTLTPAGKGLAFLRSDAKNTEEWISATKSRQGDDNSHTSGTSGANSNSTDEALIIRYSCNFNSVEVLAALEAGAISDPLTGQQPTPSNPPVSSPKVVTKTPRKPLTLVGSGSGFFVSHDGYLVTNNHVIEGCEEVLVRWDGLELVARLHGIDPSNDLALLSIDVSPETIVSFSPDKISLVETIFVGGFPFGEEVSEYVKVTKGIVSSLAGFNNNLALFQMDAAIQPGSSGGPILNENGYLVGVSVGAVDKFSQGFARSENQNFGIKSRMVEAMLDANSVEYRFGDRSKSEQPSLGKVLTNATLFLSCWMTDEQIKKARKKPN